MKQSLKSHLPLLNTVISFKKFLNIEFTENLFIAHCEKLKKATLLSSIKPKSSNLILIGPEGDFSDNEIKLATSKGFKNISLGDARFRSETAGIIACHTVSIANI